MFRSPIFCLCVCLVSSFAFGQPTVVEETTNYGYRTNNDFSTNGNDLYHSNLPSVTSTAIRYGTTMSNDALKSMQCARLKGQNEADKAKCIYLARNDAASALRNICSPLSDSSTSASLSVGEVVIGGIAYSISTMSYTKCTNEVNALKEARESYCEYSYQQTANIINRHCN